MNVNKVDSMPYVLGSTTSNLSLTDKRRPLQESQGNFELNCRDGFLKTFSHFFMHRVLTVKNSLNEGSVALLKFFEVKCFESRDPEVDCHPFYKVCEIPENNSCVTF